MSLERIVGTSNLPATLVTLSLQLWKSTGTALGKLVRGNKAAGGFYGFQEASSEPTEKQLNQQDVI